MAVVPRAGVSALAARALLRPEVPAQGFALASLDFAEVVRVRVHAQEPNERVELADSVLQRRSGQTPLLVRAQVVNALSRVRRARLDLVRLIQDDTTPLDGVQERVG